MGSPAIFGGNNTSSLLQNQIMTANGMVLQNNGAKNYITYNNFQNGLETGWTRFTATMTGGLPTGTLTTSSAVLDSYGVTSTNPLAGTYSLDVGDSTQWSAGEGFCTDVFTIDRQDQAMPLTISFRYEQTVGTMNWSGVLGSQNLAIYVWDVTNNAWVQPAGFLGMNQGTGPGYVTATFQTNALSSGNQYRICVLALQVYSSACNVKFDSFFCGPQTAPIGAVVTDWQSYTPTFTGLGTVSALTAKYARRGDTLLVQFTVTAGTTAGAPISITLPSGLSMDDTKVGANTELGKVSMSATPFSGGIVKGLSNSVVYVTADNASYLAAPNGNTWANSTLFGGTFSVPILGWSSNVEMSSSTDTRVVAMRAGGSAGGTITSEVTAVFPTAAYDTHGAYNTSTGVYTVPVTGKYRVTAQWRTSAITVTGSQTINISVRKNSTNVRTKYIYGSNQASSNYIPDIDEELDCTSGDTISIRIASDVSTTQNSSTEFNVFTVSRISGPSVIAATNTVAARYTRGSTQSIPNTGFNIIDYATKDYDTTNSVTTGSSWKFTAPVSGKYAVSAFITYDSASWTAGNYNQLNVYKNGGNYAAGQRDDQQTTVTGYFSRLVVTTVNLIAGDYIDIRASNNRSGGATNIIGDGSYNHVSIERIGN